MTSIGRQRPKILERKIKVSIRLSYKSPELVSVMQEPNFTAIILNAEAVFPHSHTSSWTSHWELNIGLSLLPTMHVSALIWEQYQNSSHALNSTLKSPVTAAGRQKWQFSDISRQLSPFSIWSWDAKKSKKWMDVCFFAHNCQIISLLTVAQFGPGDRTTRVSSLCVCSPARIEKKKKTTTNLFL